MSHWPCKYCGHEPGDTCNASNPDTQDYIDGLEAELKKYRLPDVYVPDETQARYKGYGWIRVRKWNGGTHEEFEAHHMAETGFLIDEVRNLAAEVDSLRECQASHDLHLKCWQDMFEILGPPEPENELMREDPRNRARRVVSELDGLKAARIAYASEFDGDVGNIHQNIRDKKKELSDLRERVDKAKNILNGAKDVLSQFNNPNVLLVTAALATLEGGGDDS